MWPREPIACASQCDTATAMSVASAGLRTRQPALSVGRFVGAECPLAFRLERTSSRQLSFGASPVHARATAVRLLRDLEGPPTDRPEMFIVSAAHPVSPFASCVEVGRGRPFFGLPLGSPLGF